jgi:hypothetical protein
VEFAVGQQASTVPATYDAWILNDSPVAYWKLDETSGTTATDSSGNSNTGTYQGGYTQSSSGVALNGSSGYISTTTSYASPNTFTIEAWFKTASTSGGLIMGLGTTQTGSSGSYDRHIYMTTAGKLTFGVDAGAGQTTIASTLAFNDNVWHHTVASLSGAGMALYVDGALVAQNTSKTTGQALTGYWRIGYNNIGSWPNSPTSYFLNGSFRRVAVYTAALTAKQVYAHYLEGTNPLPSTYRAGNTILDDYPIAYWRLGEKSGRVATDLSPTGNTGTYQGTFTPNQAGAITGDSDTATLFDGSTGMISSTNTYTNPPATSIEAWIKTTTTSGGVIAELSMTQTGGSGGWDRILYMEDSGKLIFGVNAGSAKQVSTSSAYNNGAWHHVVATHSRGYGNRLYVDGSLIGGNTASTNPDSYTGYWRVGQGSLGTYWTSSTSSTFFNGTIDEVAIYAYELSTSQITSHYNSGAGRAWNFCLSQTALSNSNWNLMTGFFDGTSIQLFVNGQKECSITKSPTYSSSVANLISGASASLSSYWSGLMADLKVFGTSNGTSPVSSTTLYTDFYSTANRFRQIPLENIVTSGLILSMDAANANQGIAPYSNGCASSDLSWFDLSSSIANGTLFNFSSCGSSSGWVGSGTTASPYTLAFDGSNDYVKISPSAINNLTAGTLTAWIKLTSNTGAAIFAKQQNGVQTPGVFSVGSYPNTSGSAAAGTAGKLYFNPKNGITVAASTSNLSTGTWYNVAVTFNGSQAIFYINGAQDNTVSGVYSLPDNSTTSTTATLGAWLHSTPTYYLSGNLAGFSAYNRVLSLQEIKQNCLAQQGRLGLTSCATP